MNYLSYLPVFLRLSAPYESHNAMCLAQRRRQAIVAQSHRPVLDPVPCRPRRRPAPSDARFCAGMLLPGGVMPGGMMSAMFPGGMPGMHVMQPRYR